MALHSMIYSTIIKVPDDSSTIQAGINGAENGDTVLVAEGIYKGLGNKNISFNGKAVLLISESGAIKTVIDCEKEGRGFEFINYEDNNSYVVGFTIQNGYMPSGGGFHCENSSPTIDSCIIINNTAFEHYGGGIFCQYSDAVITNCTFRGNYSHFGGAIEVRLGGSPLIKGNIIDSNSTMFQGGGIGTTNSPTPIIEDNIITRNLARDGGGIRCGAAQIRNNVITHNIAYEKWNSYLLGYGGGIAITTTFMPPVENNIIANNIAYSKSGGIFCNAYSSTFRNNIFYNNSASGGTSPGEFRCGGAIRYMGNSKTTSSIINCTFFNNKADDRGGFLYATDSVTITIKKCTISSNYSSFGGVVFDTLTSNVIFDSCLIVDNGSTINPNSGFIYTSYEAGTLQSSYSNIYYNTYQHDIEICNNTSLTFPFENNFWWKTSSDDIDSLFMGNLSYTPYLTSMISSGIPGEPTIIDSVRNYSNSEYLTESDSINENDSLFLRLYGVDRNSCYKEVGIALLRSSVYNTGIAVALLETDTNSGIFQGIALPIERKNSDSIRIDDIHQRIGVRDGVDTIKIVANMDTNKVYYVIYNSLITSVNPVGYKKISKDLQINHKKLSNKIQISFNMPEKSNVSINLYNCLGKLITSFNLTGNCGNNQFCLNTNNINTGVYFICIHSNSTYFKNKITIIK
jgi:hypothetical protein